MSLPCTTTTIAAPLNYCGANEYGVGTLYIGGIDPLITDAVVRLQHVATGRVQTAPTFVVGGEVYIEFPEDLSPGANYRISIEVDGQEVEFAPYSAPSILGTATAFAVYVNFLKSFDQSGQITSAPTQWLIV